MELRNGKRSSTTRERAESHSARDKSSENKNYKGEDQVKLNPQPLPAWVERNCVQRPESVQTEPSLLVRERTLEARVKNREEAVDAQKNDHQIDAAVLQPVLNAFSHFTQQSGLHTVQLECPSSKTLESKAIAFLGLVISYVARECKAVLMTLNSEDIQDLSELSEFQRSSPNQKSQAPLADDQSTISDSNSDDYDIHPPVKRRKTRRATRRLIHCAPPYPVLQDMLPYPSGIPPMGLPLLPSNVELKSAQTSLINFSSLLSKENSEALPFIIHFSVEGGRISASERTFIREVRQSLQSCQASVVMVVSSVLHIERRGKQSHMLPYHFGLPPPPMPPGPSAAGKESHAVRDILAILRCSVSGEKITVVPASDDKDIPWNDESASPVTSEQSNIRLLKRCLRKFQAAQNQEIDASPHTEDFLDPYREWDFLEGTIAQSALKEQSISENDIKFILNTDEPGTIQSMTQAVVDFGYRFQALEQWRKTLKEPDPDEKLASKWTEFSVPLREKLEAAKKEFGYDRFCSAHLENIVDPGDLNEGWTDIAVDSSVKSALTQLTTQAYSGATESRGILKSARIGGALLYGPPGTGKTHLARVLAKESQTIMITVSPSDINQKYVGESEHVVEALFKVAKRLVPCTIFIDEADSLFRARKPDDQRWQRDISNQWLSELDNLKRAPNPPFVLLATNHPQDLDHAFHRRVPNRLFVGLPYRSLRQDLLKLFLKDDVVDEGLDMEKLADLTYGYSGADIRNLCVQAALSCQARSKGSSKYAALAWMDFEMAFQRSGSSVSMQSLTEIRGFAQDFDPQAVSRIVEEIKPARSDGLDVLYE